ncbi:MAG: hydrogenase maturation protease [Armatimonadetes bacterium]|nr:hydrogenase maturation protease [Armatimonadota bacterium]
MSASEGKAGPDTVGTDRSVECRVLVAGVGNVLRGDDGFGPAVIHALDSAGDLPDIIKTMETGIGGMGVVHELMEGYRALILVDAVERNGAPGTLYLLEPDVPLGEAIPERNRHELATDMHRAVPDQALVVAHAVGALPPFVRILGCQPGETEELTTELSEPVRLAVPKAVEMIRVILRKLEEREGAAPSPVESGV